MRVAHLLRKLNAAEWGGTETAIQRLVEGLLEHGVAPIVYFPRLADVAQHDPLMRAGCEIRRFNAFVPIVGLSRTRKQELVALGGNLMSFDLISLLWREPDLAVIHTHALGRIGGIGLRIAKYRGIPFVVTIHGGVLDLPQKLKQEFNAPMTEGWEWGKFFGLIFQSHRLFRDADAILTCNTNEAALLQERYPEKRVVVQPHGIRMETYRADHRESARSAFPQIIGKQVLLSVGRIDAIKNQGWLVEQAPKILAGHPNVLIVLAGACTNESYGAELRQQIGRLGLSESVLLTGGLPPSDPRLIGLFQEAAAVILPSVSETFGLVILEAWASGTVVLASRTSGASALIEQEENGFLFALDDPDAFHRALAQVLANPARAEKMAAKGSEKVEREYTVSALAERVKRLYEELAEVKLCAT